VSGSAFVRRCASYIGAITLLTHKILLPIVKVDGFAKSANHCSAIVKYVYIVLDYKTIKIKDSNGEEFVCPLKALKNPKELTSEELEH
jgi:hypothetical protein